MKLFTLLAALLLLGTATLSGDKVLLNTGTAAAPTISFKDDPDTGVYRSAANEISLTAGGAAIGAFSSSLVTFSSPLKVDEDDSCPTVGCKPAYSSDKDPDTGLYFPTVAGAVIGIAGLQTHYFDANQYSFLSNGIATFQLLSTDSTSTDSVIEMGPLSDPAQGRILYDDGANVLVFRAGGLDLLSLTSAGLLTIGGASNPIPTLRIDASADTGSSKIEFGDVSNNAVGRIIYEHGVGFINGEMQFYRDATKTAKLTGSGLRQLRGSVGATGACIGAVDGDGMQVTGNCSSSKRYKKDIVDLTDNYNVDMLRPVAFKWKSDGTEDIGFIAEEVNEIMPTMVTHFKGKIQGVRYSSMVAIAFAEIKRLKKKVSDQEDQINDILNRVAALEGGH